MGRKKEILLENGRYKGKLLSSKTCSTLEKIIKLNEEHGCVSDLKNVIYNLTPSEVALVKEMKSSSLIELDKGELTDSQTLGVAFMYFAERAILGDSVGLGKTVEISGLCNLLEQEYAKRGEDFRFLYLTEKTGLSQCRDELIKFTGKYIDVLPGEKRYVEKFTTDYSEELPEYSVVGAHSLLKNELFAEYMYVFCEKQGYCPFDLLIVDESGDVLKNSKTQTYKGAEFLAKMFNRIILLNATPFEKELFGFYNQLSFIDKTFLPTKTDFTKRYVIMDYSGPYPEPSGKYKHGDEFRGLVGYRYFARTRKFLGAEMRDCSADVRVVPLSKEQKDLLKKVSMPLMVYDCPSYFNMGVETNIDTTPKLHALLDILGNEFKDEKSVLVYARYKESQKYIEELLQDAGYSVEVMNGATPQEERVNKINRFKLGDTQILVTNVQKCLNFGNCNACIFFDFDPNSNNMVQFEGRMMRSFDIVGKRVFLILTRGDELKSFKWLVANRAKASDIFAGSDFSCILSLLLDGDKLREIK